VALIEFVAVDVELNWEGGCRFPLWRFSPFFGLLSFGCKMLGGFYNGNRWVLTRWVKKAAVCFGSLSTGSRIAQSLAPTGF
jgi:hypothetical protein